eukprot:8710521-Lingulodinium_polyedra.AAC.1
MVKALAAKGSAGGLAAGEIEYRKVEEDYVRATSQEEKRPAEMGHEVKAKEDRYWMIKKLRKMSKRKLWPPWGVPAEALLMGLLPKYRSKWRRAGLGYEAEAGEEDAVEFNRRWLEMLVTIRREGATPLSWHRSMAFFIPKMNAAKGVSSLRLLHCFDAAGMAWFGGRQLHAAASKEPPWCIPAWVHGCVPG